MPTAPPKAIASLRLSRELRDEVRSIATREGETESTIYRRLLRRGLETEHARRSHRQPGDEAA